MLKSLLLSATVFLSLPVSVRAEWNGLSEAEIQNCANHIFSFEQLKIDRSEIMNGFAPGSRGFGTDLAELYINYSLSVALDEVKAQCKGDYNARAIAYVLYRQGDIDTPMLNDRL